MKHRPWSHLVAALGLLVATVSVPRDQHVSASLVQTREPATLYVRPGGTSTTCSSWSDACDLQAALDAARSGDEIWVAAGTYKPSETDRSDSFVLRSGVAVYGGFAGTEESREERDWETYLTLLSGDIGASEDGTDNSYHVVYSSGLTETAVLDGFTISGGYADGSDLHGHGGGMYNGNSSPTLTNLIFSGNRAHYDGGGMANYHNSNPALANVTFSNNSADEDGECNSHRSPAQAKATLPNVAFASRSADWQEGGGLYSPPRSLVLAPAGVTSETGGGMVNDNSSPTLTHVTFSGNCATWGGGMLNTYSSPKLTNVTFSDNLAFDQGGGMYNYPYCHPVLTDVTFSNNLAWSYGGGMYNSFSNPVLIRVAFIRNASALGGGMGNWSSKPLLTNVAFTGNSADFGGGGMENYSSAPVLTNVTFEGNSAGRNGGGMLNVSSSPALTNCILWGNAATSAGDQIYNGEDSTPSIRYGDVEGSNGSGGSWDTSLGTDGGGNIDADPRFVDAANGDLRLQLTSPAIDAGDNSAVPAEVTTDLGGHPRFVDIPSIPDTGYKQAEDGRPLVDMGAQEAQYLMLSVTKVGNGSGTITSDPPGIDCGLDCTEIFDYDTTVTLTATADISSTFRSWSGACTGSGDCTLSMDSAQLVTATFALANLDYQIYLPLMTREMPSSVRESSPP